MHLLPLILMLLLLASCGQPPCQEAEKVAPSIAEGEIPVAALDAREVVAALERIEIEAVTEWQQLAAPPSDLESLLYIVVHRDQAFDGFIYAAVFARNEPLFWIHRTGGFAGVNEFYGPASLADGEIVEVVDP